MDEVHIERIGGLCPVQAEGTIGGKPFYFRARHQQWSLSIGGADVIMEPEWHTSQPWGNGPFDAGYMPVEDAAAIIEHQATIYLLQQGTKISGKSLET